jgi:hypothetical protein
MQSSSEQRATMSFVLKLVKLQQELLKWYVQPKEMKH